jgi:hypothetical protein
MNGVAMDPHRIENAQELVQVQSEEAVDMVAQLFLQCQTEGVSRKLTKMVKFLAENYLDGLSLTTELLLILQDMNGVVENRYNPQLSRLEPSLN